MKLKVVFILSLCRSMSTLKVCLKCGSFIWHNEYFTEESTRLNCSATDEFTSLRKLGQMLRLLNFSSGLLWFFWWNLSYREYLSDVFVIGCLAAILTLSGISCSGNVDRRFFTHCRSTFNCLSAASFLLFDVVPQSLPSNGWKYCCFVRLFV